MKSAVGTGASRGRVGGKIDLRSRPFGTFRRQDEIVGTATIDGKTVLTLSTTAP